MDTSVLNHDRMTDRAHLPYQHPAIPLYIVLPQVPSRGDPGPDVQAGGQLLRHGHRVWVLQRAPRPMRRRRAHQCESPRYINRVTTACVQGIVPSVLHPSLADLNPPVLVPLGAVCLPLQVEPGPTGPVVIEAPCASSVAREVEASKEQRANRLIAMAEAAAQRERGGGGARGGGGGGRRGR